MRKGGHAMNRKNDSTMQWAWLLVCGVLAAVYLLLL